MKEQEAIKRLAPIVNNEAYTDSFSDACKMAIKALKRQISLQRIVERLEGLQVEYMYPDDDDYIVGQYDGVREALTVVLEEGGLNG